jgi:hypothetical protein
LKVKLSCIKLTLLTKRGLNTLDRSWDEWRSQNSQRSKKFRRAQSKVTQMMSFAYDHRGIIMTEFHVEQVWQQCIFVTGCKRCAEKCTKTDLTCSGWATHFADRFAK